MKKILRWGIVILFLFTLLIESNAQNNSPVFPVEERIAQHTTFSTLAFIGIVAIVLLKRKQRSRERK